MSTNESPIAERKARLPVPALKKGVVLAIVGPQGSGKTLQAQTIAGSLGIYWLTQQPQFSFAFTPGSIASPSLAGVKTVILELEPNELLRPDVVETINRLTRESVLKVRAKGGKEHEIQSPHVVICAHDTDFYAHANFDHIEIVTKHAPISESKLQGDAT